VGKGGQTDGVDVISRHAIGRIERRRTVDRLEKKAKGGPQGRGPHKKGKHWATKLTKQGKFRKLQPKGGVTAQLGFIFERKPPARYGGGRKNRKSGKRDPLTGRRGR